MYYVHLYVPSKNALLSFEPGTGDNLTPEDEDEGFNDYLNWGIRSLDTVNTDEGDGGMVLFDNTKTDYNTDLLAAIPIVLDEVFGDPNLKFTLLSTPEDAGVTEMSRMLTISSGHLTPKTRAKLDEEVAHPFDELGLAVYHKGPYGWYVYLSDSEVNIYGLTDALVSFVSGAPEHPITGWEKYPDLMRIMLFAMKRGIDILCIDSEGEVVTGLPFYPEEQ